MITTAPFSSASPALLSSAWLTFAQAGTEAGPAPTAPAAPAPAATAPAAPVVAAPAGQAINPLAGGAAAPLGTAGAPGSVTATGPAAKPNALGAAVPLFLMMGLLVLMVAFSFLASRKEKKRRAELMSALKKGSRIVTNSGIVGEVYELNDNDVVLRLEEGKMRISKGAIASVAS